MVKTGQTTGKLIGRDFITAGIFSALALVTMMIASVANLVPQAYFAYSAVTMLFMGPVYLLYTSKVPKRWAIVLFCVMPALFLCLSGAEGIMAAITIIAFAVVADLIVGTDRLNFKKLAIAYAILAMALEIGTQVRLFLFTNDYLQNAVKNGLDQSYIDYLSQNATFTTWGIFIVITIAAAIAGLLIGKFLAKKQLEKAGIA